MKQLFKILVITIIVDSCIILPVSLYIGKIDLLWYGVGLLIQLINTDIKKYLNKSNK